MDFLSIRDCYKEGYSWGWSLASWNPLPELGSTLSRSIDWQGVGTVDSVEAQLDAWRMLLSAADEHARSYSPFEFTARDINLRDEALGEGASSEGWEAFERGMEVAFNDYRRKHYPLRELKRRFKEWESSNGR